MIETARQKLQFAVFADTVCGNGIALELSNSNFQTTWFQNILMHCAYEHDLIMYQYAYA